MKNNVRPRVFRYSSASLYLQARLGKSFGRLFQQVIRFDVFHGLEYVFFDPAMVFIQAPDEVLYVLALGRSGCRTWVFDDRQALFPGKSL